MKPAIVAGHFFGPVGLVVAIAATGYMFATEWGPALLKSSREKQLNEKELMAMAKAAREARENDEAHPDKFTRLKGIEP